MEDSNDLGANKPFLEQLTSHMKKIVTKELDGVYDELDNIKESKETHRNRKHGKEKMHPSPRVSEGIPSPFLNAYDDHDARIDKDDSRKHRASTSHRTHNIPYTMHDVSSDSEEELHDLPRHHRTRNHRHVHDDLRDGNRHDMPRPNARNGHENRYLGVKLEIPTFDGNVNPEKYLEWEMRLDQIFEAHGLMMRGK